MGKDEEQQRKNQEDERNDPQLMEIASKFVNEIIETAKMEAARRQKVMITALFITVSYLLVCGNAFATLMISH